MKRKLLPCCYGRFSGGLCFWIHHRQLAYVFAWTRGKPASSVSTGVLDLSKEKSAAKPPGRPSIQSKTIVIPDLRPVDTITPIFETRTNRWICYQPGGIFKFQCILSKEGN
ncbi:uncharacterized protein LOC132633570 [Lycium barbarum]|uniref:uncharacterized protein LOC132633570 n=1 Tax=Lycium barbarum TaxID=112863 RepID=UPI00293E37CF|nr:uncharacterized protein LOC132633570 [Lycium barbarum]XP_060206054.1 uncharacterized protein LOC132633570 [Lycium barbarum]XP_060206055.1 uncharacterized protein LOC132633570 [Lycium barbarum]XP_060206056.1 uncharacterized protein LOC132633570 [Lycium barbarum]XP_060206057.1 uncharacterized protein LOC132633570 [Lycium barbarum]